ncbi:unnamed protein product [Rotaria sordida]|uniref:Uncharacterized protein n=1 Tax=Rotaria sordida TaxID=392033 RepID=A0A814ICH9_9BILA|nr:unnamed protein product [Rotaria sordida]CAF1019894.1 unnamed protein product [Rotaria sordida]CAF1022294.1 unnamed protein product [Rotaria sordida]CAF3532493.1 unnamed protein product [Rotaria sordida]CAF3956916.1 unnamed protein product [Rotaria sordida]
MHSTSISLLAFGLLVTVAMARPWSGHSHGHTGDGTSQGSNGHRWVKFHSPRHIFLPRHLAEKLERPWPAFTARKIANGKYMLIGPALIFKVKATDDISTTSVPEISTTEQPEVEETTTESIVEESTPEPEETTSEPEPEETTPEPEPEETTQGVPSFFKKGSYSINNDEQLYFFQ